MRNYASCLDDFGVHAYVIPEFEIFLTGSSAFIDNLQELFIGQISLNIPTVTFSVYEYVMFSLKICPHLLHCIYL